MSSIHYPHGVLEWSIDCSKPIADMTRVLPFSSIHSTRLSLSENNNCLIHTSEKGWGTALLPLPSADSQWLIEVTYEDSEEMQLIVGVMEEKQSSGRSMLVYSF